MVDVTAIRYGKGDNPATRHSTALHHLSTAFAWISILALYLYVGARSLQWIITETELISAPALFWIALPVFTYALIWKFGWPSQVGDLYPKALIAVCAILSIWAYPILQQLSAAFILLGLYGFFTSLERVSPDLWQKGFILAGLGSLALPFALVPGTGMGFYLRLMTADTAAQLLAAMGHVSLGAHDILIFDNGIAQVDIPCSGLKSLFTGTAFFLVASIILRRSMSITWLATYSIFMLLMLIANTVRITLLIWLSEILQMRAFAENIHMPLGLVLFCAVCIAGIFMLLKTKPYQTKTRPNLHITENRLRWRQIGLGALLVLLFGLVLVRPAPAPNINTNIRPFATLGTSEIPLSETEQNFFAAREQTQAAKWAFTYEGLSGSMLVVRSRAVNGLHAPEVCMLGNGISVQSMTREPLNDGNSYRWLTVDDSRRNAVYWMQSGNIITDDFRRRLAAYIFGGHSQKKRAGNKNWTMVTLLFDQRHNLDTPDVQNLMAELQSHYAKIQ